MAFMEERHITLINTLDQPITAILSGRNQTATVLESAILPGEERRIAFPCARDPLRVFTGEAEACVYMARER